MIGLVFYVFSTFGLAYIVGHSTITKPLREWIWGQNEIARNKIVGFLISLIECPACFGFWTGVVMAAIQSVPFDIRFNSIAWGLFTAGTNFTIAKLTKLI